MSRVTKTLARFFTNCLTEKDNATFSLQKTLTACMVLTYIALSIADVILSKDFEYQQFAMGGAALLGLAGAGIAFQSNSETKPKGDG